MKYICKNCDYETYDKSNYNRHLKSKLHLTNNISDYILEQKKQKLKEQKKLKIIEDDRKFICNKCNKEFSFSSGLYRHKKKCQIKLTIVGEKKENIILKKQENDAIKTLQASIDKLTEVMIKFNDNNKTQKITNNYVTVKYITHNNINTPGLEEFDYSQIFNKYNAILGVEEEEDNSKSESDNSNSEDNNNQVLIKENKFDKRLMEQLIMHYKNKTLYKYLGNLLILFFKKDDSYQQPIWTSDIARLSYLVKFKKLLESKINENGFVYRKAVKLL